MTFTMTLTMTMTMTMTMISLTPPPDNLNSTSLSPELHLHITWTQHLYILKSAMICRLLSPEFRMLKSPSRYLELNLKISWPLHPDILNPSWYPDLHLLISRFPDSTRWGRSKAVLRACSRLKSGPARMEAEMWQTTHATDEFSQNMNE